MPVEDAGAARRAARHARALPGRQRERVGLGGGRHLDAPRAGGTRAARRAARADGRARRARGRGRRRRRPPRAHASSRAGRAPRGRPVAALEPPRNRSGGSTGARPSRGRRGLACRGDAPASAGSRPLGDVAALQVALQARGRTRATVDGVARPGNDAGACAAPGPPGLAADGTPGPRRAARSAAGAPAWGSRPLRAGTRGWDVAGDAVPAPPPGLPVRAVDGGFGPRSRRGAAPLPGLGRADADGVAGPSTAPRCRAGAALAAALAPPVGAPVGDRFGPRGERFHAGLDYPAPAGTPVGAAGRGCVSTAGWDPGGYGNLVVDRAPLRA